jgi:hypothetical protein
LEINSNKKRKKNINIKKYQNDISKEKIKIGLDVDFHDCGSTPNMSELVDSDNSLKLDDEQKHKYFIKNLSKKYNFTTNNQVKLELDKYKNNKENNKNLNLNPKISTEEMKRKKSNLFLIFNIFKYNKKI